MDKNFWKDMASGWFFHKEKLPWPLDETGEKEKAVMLTQGFDSLADVDMTVSFLTAYGIPCFKHYDKEGTAGKVINGFSGFGADVYVPASRAEEAMALLSADICEEE